jgi:hypothetical protein
MAVNCARSCFEQRRKQKRDTEKEEDKLQEKLKTALVVREDCDIAVINASELLLSQEELIQIFQINFSGQKPVLFTKELTSNWSAHRSYTCSPTPHTHTQSTHTQSTHTQSTHTQSAHTHTHTPLHLLVDRCERILGVTHEGHSTPQLQKMV